MAGSTENGSGPGQGPAPKKTYAVDVRVFLVGVTAAMALSFGLGVALGPSTAAEVSARIASPAGPPDRTDHKKACNIAEHSKTYQNL